MPLPKPGKEKKPPKPRESVGVYFEPSPWEFREFKEWAKSCVPSLGELWKVRSEHGLVVGFDSPKQYFDWHWKFDEAEAIHKAFQT